MMSANVDMEWQYSNALPYLLIPSFLQCFHSQSREATGVVKGMTNLASSVPYTINGLLGKGWGNVVFFGHFTWRDCFVSDSLMEFSVCVSVSVGVDN
jgi:hypothetical protein